jgi:hypothetical protein
MSQYARNNPEEPINHDWYAGGMRIGSPSAMGSGLPTGPQDEPGEAQDPPTCGLCGSWMEQTAQGWACPNDGLGTEEK